LKGKIVLIPFPFTDLSSSKLRPTLVIHEGEADVIAAFITSQSRKQEQNSVVIDSSHPEYQMTGLRVSSAIRLDKIATIKKSLIIGEIGEIGSTLRRDINKTLSTIFTV